MSPASHRRDHKTTEVNGALHEVAMEDTEAISWVDVGPGIAERLLERTRDGGFRQTRVLQLSQGAELTLPDHGGGEDMYVMEGSITLEVGTSGDIEDESYPAGTYIGLPTGDRPRLTASWGCTLFSKSRPSLRRERVIVRTKRARWEASGTAGFSLMRLDDQPDGRAVLLRFDPGTELGPHRHEAGEEFFVLRGAIRDDNGVYGPHWWVRQPAGSTHSIVSEPGCTMFTTAGHLGRAST